MVVNGDLNKKRRRYKAEHQTRVKKNEVTIQHKNPHIERVAVLQRNPDKEYALEILKDIAHRVSYLMKENKFAVKDLVEFYPKDKRLLGMNVNRGAKIMLRLRSPYDEFQFLPRESIMGTMLHELTHNIFGPHDKNFYSKLDNLAARQWVIEQQNLYDHFVGTGAKLGAPSMDFIGGSKNNRVNEKLVRTKRINNVNFTNGKVLGSYTNNGRRIDVVNTKSAKEMAAIAAERRFKDNLSCGEGHSIDIEQPEQGELTEVYVLTDSESESEGTVTDQSGKRSKEEQVEKNIKKPKKNDDADIEIIDLT
ncbi:hypothetical protein TPHA_0F02070 [Tetrapisispora phaffii CBS 4417]|uniref:WLM domain-containing protein n=1 Tax=Tetrapisispora phaffii (strain ATCC 24235 / CBS 4417 / NBRC 1672 / NRRL Y-8282 / UCD 70-5) TaxID=1071381 RepID=G8BVA7_TETPH|nr:hypothetical protein TPHA_0F02070 [Tetrapisispora phaffii CBS 4417]CCE63689.1 hypothetical protein TPHA_0F02070 [Tetrapisispora phaffii CBS 4417]